MSLSKLNTAGLSAVNLWKSLIDGLTNYVGDSATFVILVLGVSKLISAYNAYLFEFAHQMGWWQQYRIQQDRMVDPKTTREALEGRYGLKSYIGLILVGVPITYAQYFIYKKAYGFDVKTLPGSFSQFSWDLFKCIFAWDTSLFWIHYTLHYFPWLYKNIHKRHHEFKTVNVAVGGHLTFIDNLLMTFAPIIIGVTTSKSTFLGLFVFQAFFTHIASRAHCGYELPWDPLNWVFPYCAYHDFHHLKTHYNFQTLFVFWDLIVGGNAQGCGTCIVGNQQTPRRIFCRRGTRPTG
ncbi:hypothetical protein M427DRAFT_218382 [Gonapodya prolifera JEL478]|uniref:Fatty acid hydroxylase domain-containing protein n=1 Tax=Gonapodya prolifera (strain JEL478) TaxID=1344416 RepID=A0A138ZYV5_GONPJ|nr:hypothetical protein M427DRAFT_218382 [Gonapodya prolifera JEL478]|eukprot:KXS09598.1 hypothetical protein M427DRAFT_218382 [Gonapodya prolifera JEL478]